MISDTPPASRACQRLSRLPSMDPRWVAALLFQTLPAHLHLHFHRKWQAMLEHLLNPRDMLSSVQYVLCCHANPVDCSTVLFRAWSHRNVVNNTNRDVPRRFSSLNCQRNRCAYIPHQDYIACPLHTGGRWRWNNDHGLRDIGLRFSSQLSLQIGAGLIAEVPFLVYVQIKSAAAARKVSYCPASQDAQTHHPWFVETEKRQRPSHLPPTLRNFGHNPSL